MTESATRRRGTWTLYRVGQRVGHVEIVAVEVRGQLQTDIHYTGRLLCCGRLVVRTHKALAGQVQRGVQMCEECRKASEKGCRPRVIPTSPMAIFAAGMWWTSLGTLGRL